MGGRCTMVFPQIMYPKMAADWWFIKYHVKWGILSQPRGYRAWFSKAHPGIHDKNDFFSVNISMTPPGYDRRGRLGHAITVVRGWASPSRRVLYYSARATHPAARRGRPKNDRTLSATSTLDLSVGAPITRAQEKVRSPQSAMHNYRVT